MIQIPVRVELLFFALRSYLVMDGFLGHYLFLQKTILLYQKELNPNESTPWNQNYPPSKQVTAAWAGCFEFFYSSARVELGA